MRSLAFVAGVALLFMHPDVAEAGMPVVRLSDLARMRVQTISFFLVGLLVSAGLIQLIWNRLGKDFAVLPRLGYCKAVGLVTLWGLLFVLVLTMISGARELLTPGAWEKQGATYRLAKDPPPPAAAPAEDPLEKSRRDKLDELRAALWQYADSHDGHFPADAKGRDIPSDKWHLPDVNGLRYFYVTGHSANNGKHPLVYEPGIYGSHRFVLFIDGEIKSLELADIVQALASAEKR